MAAPATPRPTSPPGDLIQSLQRGLHVLEYVAQAPGPVAPKQIASALGLKLATAYHLVNTLLHEGYLRREPCRGLVLGETKLGAPPPPRTALDTAPFVPLRRALGRAAYAVSDVVLMTMLDDSRAVVVASEEVPGAPSAGRYAVGSCHLAHASAAGRAMLGSHEAAETERLLRRCVGQARAFGTAFDEEVVATDIDRVRRHGVGFAHTAFDACVGAPITDRHGRSVGAVAVVVTPPRLDREPARLAEVARSTAQSISNTLTRLELTGQLAGGLPEALGVPAVRAI